jgi:hypothetical protein
MKKTPLISLAIAVLLIALLVIFFFMKNNGEQNTVNQTPTSADNAPPGSIHNLPVPDAVAAVRTLAASDLGTSEGLVIILSAYERQWPDACLGLPEEDELCAQVITPGYEVTVQAEGRQYIYHTNSNGSVIRERKN